MCDLKLRKKKRIGRRVADGCDATDGQQVNEVLPLRVAFYL